MTQSNEPLAQEADGVKALDDLSLPVVATLYVARGDATARAIRGVEETEDGHFDLVKITDVAKALEPYRAALSHPEPVAQEAVAWRHRIVEPDGKDNILLSHSENNPWSHWLEKHRAECQYSVTPLYAHPSPSPEQGEDTGGAI